MPQLSTHGLDLLGAVGPLRTASFRAVASASGPVRSASFRAASLVRTPRSGTLLATGRQCLTPSSAKREAPETLKGAVMDAILSGDVPAVEQLQQQGVRLERVVTAKGTVLHVAAMEGCPQMTSHLLSQPTLVACLERVDQAGRTPLHVAAAFDNAGAVQQLLEARADVKACDHSEWTPLHWAAYGDHVAVAQALLGAGADPHQSSSSGQTPLSLSAESVEEELKAVFEKYHSCRAHDLQQGSEDEAASRAVTPSAPQTAASVGEFDSTWVGFQGPNGKPYYLNRLTKETTWTMPSHIVVSWYAFKTPEGALYFWCSGTDTTTWELPRLQTLGADMEEEQKGHTTPPTTRSGAVDSTVRAALGSAGSTVSRRKRPAELHATESTVSTGEEQTQIGLFHSREPSPVSNCLLDARLNTPLVNSPLAASSVAAVSEMCCDALDESPGSSAPDPLLHQERDMYVADAVHHVDQELPDDGGGEGPREAQEETGGSF